MKASPLKRATLLVSALCAAAAVVAGMQGLYTLMGSAAIAACALLAVYFQGHPTLKTFTFTFWVFALFFAGLVFPSWFLTVGGFDQGQLIVPLIQIIMFGMGATLSLDDFARALKMPRAVLLGMFLQFTVMPLTGWTVAGAFGFEPEIAAGIILIGSCSGGVASNVMAFLAKGNVALSVTMTACSTLMAPFVTPLAMQLLAGKLVPIDTLAMMLSIVDLIILPIAAGLITHYLLHAGLPGRVWRSAALAFSLLFFALAWLGLPGPARLYSLAAACLLMAILQQSWLEQGLPLLSMSAICYIIAIIAAKTRTQILEVGVGLFAAAIIHNLVGYVLGYWGSRVGRLDERDCRTVAFEVGMQNGGMGTALAINVLQSANAAIGPAIFGTWMNISGSVLASWWRERMPKT